MVLKFISRVLMFLSIPAVLLGGWAVFIITLDYHSYHSSLPVPEGRDIVVCGDSHSKDCIDPDCFLRLHNFSTAASDPEQNYLRLKDVLKTNTSNLKYVLLDITPLQLGFNELRKAIRKGRHIVAHSQVHLIPYRQRGSSITPKKPKPISPVKFHPSTRKNHLNFLTG